MTWRREPHPPSPFRSSIARSVSVLGVVCLESSPQGIMRGPRPDGKLQLDFLRRVSFSRSYRLSGCNGLSRARAHVNASWERRWPAPVGRRWVGSCSHRPRRPVRRPCIQWPKRGHPLWQALSGRGRAFQEPRSTPPQALGAGSPGVLYDMGGDRTRGSPAGVCLSGGG